MVPNGYLNQYGSSSMGFCDIHLKAISQEVLMNTSTNMCLEIRLPKLLHFPVVSKLILWVNLLSYQPDA